MCRHTSSSMEKFYLLLFQLNYFIFVCLHINLFIYDILFYLNFFLLYTEKKMC